MFSSVLKNKHDTEVFMNGFILGSGNINASTTESNLVDYIISQPSFATYDYGNGWTADILIIDDTSRPELIIPSIGLNNDNTIHDYSISVHHSVRINHNGKFVWANLKDELWETHQWYYSNGELYSKIDYTFTNVNITYASKTNINYTADFNQVATYFDGVTNSWTSSGTAKNGCAYIGQFNSICKVITALSIEELAEAYSSFMSS